MCQECYTVFEEVYELKTYFSETPLNIGELQGRGIQSGVSFRLEEIEWQRNSVRVSILLQHGRRQGMRT